MADMDSTQTDGTQNANSDVSSQAVQPGSFDPQKFAADLKAQIMAAVNDPKQIQSQKDRVIAEVKKDKSMKSLLAELKAMEAEGMTRPEIERELRLRDLEAAQSQSAVPTQSAGRVVEQDTNNLVNSVISVLKLDYNDPAVMAIVSNGQSAEQVAALAMLSAQRTSRISNPAAVALPSGGGNPTPNAAQLEAQYRQEVMSNRGKPDVIRAIKTKFAQQGLDVHSVNFTL
jgi:hypothetical protein